MTGGWPWSSKEIIYPFGRYELKIILSEANEFIGVSEIKVNKSFLNYSQKLSATDYHDVDAYYSEEQD